MTAAYVVLTHRLSRSASLQLREARRARFDARMPIVTVSGAAALEAASEALVISVNVENHGPTPAWFELSFPESWSAITPTSAPNDEGVAYLEIAPGKTGFARVQAPLASGTPLVTIAGEELLSFSLGARVSPPGGSVEDVLGWGCSYDVANERIRGESQAFLVETRNYVALDGQGAWEDQ